jgi:hypothetical protein
MKTQIKKILSFSLAAFFVSAFFAGCSSSKLIDSWKDETYRPAPTKNVLVIAINNNKAKRRLWEKTFVETFKDHGIKAEPSFKYYPNDSPQEKDIPDLFKNNFDRVVLIQMVSQEEKKYHVPGSVYYEPSWGFRRWYGMGYSRMCVPGYVQKEHVTQIETTVWEPSEDGKMIWSGTTETVNPDSPQQFSKDVSFEIIPKILADKILIQRKQRAVF